MVRFLRSLFHVGVAGVIGCVAPIIADGREIDMSGHHVASPQVPYTHAFRIELSFDGGKARTNEVHRVAMRAPASASAVPVNGQSGVWVELRAEGGRVLYHRSLRTPHLDSVEVFEDAKAGGIRRVPTNRSEAKLDVIVPDLPEASELVLYGPRDLSEAHKSSVPLLRSSMRELRGEATKPPARPGGESQRP